MCCSSISRNLSNSFICSRNASLNSSTRVDREILSRSAGGAPEEPPNSRKASLRRALCGLSSRPVILSRQLRGWLDGHLVATQVVGELDKPEPGRPRAQCSGGHDDDRPDQEKARRAVHPLQGAATNHGEKRTPRGDRVPLNRGAVECFQRHVNHSLTFLEGPTEAASASPSAWTTRACRGSTRGYSPKIFRGPAAHGSKLVFRRVRERIKEGRQLETVGVDAAYGDVLEDFQVASAEL